MQPHSVAESVDVAALPHQIGDGRVGLEGMDHAVRANQFGHKQAIIAEVGADIGHHHPRLHHRAQRLGEPHLPETVEQQVGGQTDIARIDEHLVAAEHPAKAGVIAEVGVGAKLADLSLIISPPADLQIAQVEQMARGAARPMQRQLQRSHACSVPARGPREGGLLRTP